MYKHSYSLYYRRRYIQLWCMITHVIISNIYRYTYIYIHLYIYSITYPTILDVHTHVHKIRFHMLMCIYIYIIHIIHHTYNIPHILTYISIGHDISQAPPRYLLFKHKRHRRRHHSPMACTPWSPAPPWRYLKKSSRSRSWENQNITNWKITIFHGKMIGKPWENGDLYGKIHHAINR